jgi:hypothetical protein
VRRSVVGATCSRWPADGKSRKTRPNEAVRKQADSRRSFVWLKDVASELKSSEIGVSAIEVEIAAPTTLDTQAELALVLAMNASGPIGPNGSSAGRIWATALGRFWPGIRKPAHENGPESKGNYNVWSHWDDWAVASAG